MNQLVKNIILSAGILIGYSHMNGQSIYDDRWTQVEQMESKGLIRSSLDSVDAILLDAQHAKNYPNWTKAYMYKQRFTSQLEEEGTEKAIMRMEKDLEGLDQPVKSIVEHFVGLYYSQLIGNQHRFGNRTEYLSENEDDIRTWSYSKLEQQARTHLLAFLDAPIVKEINLKNYGLLFERAEKIKWDATLYDFFMHATIDYFSNAQIRHSPKLSYTPNGETWLSDASIYMNSYLDAQDTADYRFINSQLYQYWLSHHTATTDAEAFALINAKRLQYGQQLVRNDTLYEKSLQRAVEVNDINGCVYQYHLAQHYIGLGGRYAYNREEKYRIKLKEAYNLASECKDCSLIDDACDDLVKNLSKSSFGLSIEQINDTNTPINASLRFKNVDEVYIHTFELDENSWFSSFYDNRGNFKIPANVDFVKTKRIRLPKEVDYQEHLVDLLLDGLSDGAYALIVSDNKEYQQIKGPNRQIDIQKIQVSDMALIHKGQTDKQSYFIVKRQKGNPINKAKISIYSQEHRQSGSLGHLKYSYVTDKDGRVERGNIKNRQSQRGYGRESEVLVISKGKDRLIVDQQFYIPSAYHSKDRQVIHFFADRAIYRPGQTIHFKGLVLNRSHEGLHTIIQDQEVEILFRDANGKEIQKKSLTSNSFGSVHGSFEIPTGLVNGSFSLSASGSYHRFQVEEYKRPTFEATFDSLRGDYVVGQTVMVSGIANNLAGNPLTGAAVDYRIVRNTYFPYWHNSNYFNYCFPNYQRTKEIANGRVETDDLGKFSLDFLAIKNEFMNNRFSPIYHYEVTVTVIDITGESHDFTQSVMVGPTAVKVDIQNDEWVDMKDPMGIKLISKNYNELPASINGHVTISELDSPNKWIPKRLLPKPDWTLDYTGDQNPNWSYAQDPTDQTKWPAKRKVYDGNVFIEEKLEIDLNKIKLRPGKYKIAFIGNDKFNNEVKAEKFVDIGDLGKADLPDYALNYWGDINASYNPGDEVIIDLIAGSEQYVLISVDRKEGTKRSYWQKVKGAESFSFDVTEQDRGNIKIDLTSIYGGRLVSKAYVVQVPWTNKDLNIEHASFRDKLEPGQKEKWIIKISGVHKDILSAEMVSTLYDASLDAFKPHEWKAQFYPMNYLPAHIQSFGIGGVAGNYGSGHYYPHHGDFLFFPPLKNFGFPMYFGGINYRNGGPVMMEMAMAEDGSSPSDQTGIGKLASKKQENAPPAPPPQSERPNNDNQNGPPLIRTNLKETVFFYPDLRTDAEGNILIEFTMNEALTKWKFLSFAHTENLEYALSTKEVVTVKDFMVFPLLPRFLRESDTISIRSKVVNLTDTTREVTAYIEMKDIQDQSKNDLFDLDSIERKITLLPNESKIVSWRLAIPEIEKMDLAKIAVYAKSGNKSDGEESLIPILTNRKLITEAIPLPIKRNESRAWDLKRLLEVQASKTAKLRSYTLEVSSNPAWYAVLALPYLDQQDGVTTTGKMNQFYSNQLASHIVEQNPAIVDIINVWQQGSRSENGDAFISQLEKNQNLKNILIEQTPWVMQAKSEEEQRRRIAMLFDLNTLSRSQNQLWNKIRQAQNADGGFSWVPGGRSDWFTALQVLSSLVNLTELGALNTQLPQMNLTLKNAIKYSDRKLLDRWEYISKKVNQKLTALDENQLTATAVLHMYVRSHLSESNPLEEDYSESFQFFQNQLTSYWHELNLYQQGLTALSLSKLDNDEVVPTMLQSIKERSLIHDELGSYWKQGRGYYWYQRPIETQALMIRLFDKLTADTHFVDQLKTWLLKHKQTNSWETGRATAEAIHALLVTDSDALLDGELVLAYIGPIQVVTDQFQAGLGYYSKTYFASELPEQPDRIKLENPNDHIAWGSVYWQYFEDLDNIKSFEETPLKIHKTLTKRIQTDKGYKLKDITESTLNVGDRLVSRIEIRVDRNMDYVHLQDLRGSGLEPVDVISGHRYQDGLRYYQSSKDVSTEFFIRHLRPGTYVFEYPLKVSHSGNFSNGIATIQSYYAPEFVSHSQGERIEILD